MDEYIEREALLSRFAPHSDSWVAIKYMNAADVAEVRHGRWMDNTFCSCCNWFEEDDKGNILMSFYNFCPCCGAKMDGGADHAVD